MKLYIVDVQAVLSCYVFEFKSPMNEQEQFSINSFQWLVTREPDREIIVDVIYSIVNVMVY